MWLCSDEPNIEHRALSGETTLGVGRGEGQGRDQWDRGDVMALPGCALDIRRAARMDPPAKPDVGASRTLDAPETMSVGGTGTEVLGGRPAPVV